MYIIKVLKRRDAASVIVAVVLALVLTSIVTVLTGDLSAYLAGIESTSGTEWRENIVRPLIAAALQLIVLEIVLRIAINVRPMFVRRSR